MALSYSIITPARNEAASLPPLAACLRTQTRTPREWVISENGSSDETPILAGRIAAELPWARVVAAGGAGEMERGAPIVRALHAGLSALGTPPPDVVVFLDADVSVDTDYFERLVDAFEAVPNLGIASGSAWEKDGDEWRQRFVTGGTVWGATRAYRWQCLQDVLPLEERHGWDGIDQLKARGRGWETRTLLDLPFRHLRPEGARDSSTWSHWRVNGDTAHFMGYRTWYLVARTMHHVRRDPAAVALLYGFLRARARRSPQLADARARAMLRRDQSFFNVLRRRREALGRSAPRGNP
jgi:poly-beta-1,6-N-acetyl-D-glucosamine synthase